MDKVPEKVGKIQDKTAEIQEKTALKILKIWRKMTKIPGKSRQISRQFFKLLVHVSLRITLDKELDP